MCLTSTICAKPITFMEPGIYGHELRNLFLHFQALRFIVRRPLGLQRKDTQQRSAKTKCVKPNTFIRQSPCTVACVEAEHPRRYARSQLLPCDDNHALVQEVLPGIYGHELRNICLHFQALRFIFRRPLGLQRKDTQQRSAKTACVKPNTF